MLTIRIYLAISIPYFVINYMQTFMLKIALDFKIFVKCLDTLGMCFQRIFHLSLY